MSFLLYLQIPGRIVCVSSVSAETDARSHILTESLSVFHCSRIKSGNCAENKHTRKNPAVFEQRLRPSSYCLQYPDIRKAEEENRDRSERFPKALNAIKTDALRDRIMVGI